MLGAIIDARQPRNVMGWLFAGVGILAAFGSAEAYANYALPRAVDPPVLAVAAAWLNSWFWYPLIALVVLFIPMLFPTGRLLSRRWRPLLIAAVALVAFVTGSSMFTERLTGNAYDIANPMGIPGLRMVEDQAAWDLLGIGLAMVGLTTAASLVVRFRRSRGIERQQLKWFTAAGVMMVTVTVTSDLLPIPDALDTVLFGLLMGLMPLAAGLAILRYRLYDIDRIVSKALVYVIVTAALAGVYGVVVLGPQLLFFGVGGDAPDLVIAAFTLVAAALFRPLRRRVQGFVDRRFYRSRYDARRTVEAFGSRLRNQVDLQELTDELVATVRASVRPRGAWLWMGPARAER